MARGTAAPGSGTQRPSKCAGCRAPPRARPGLRGRDPVLPGGGRRAPSRPHGAGRAGEGAADRTFTAQRPSARPVSARVPTPAGDWGPSPGWGAGGGLRGAAGPRWHWRGRGAIAWTRPRLSREGGGQPGPRGFPGLGEQRDFQKARLALRFRPWALSGHAAHGSALWRRRRACPPPTGPPQPCPGTPTRATLPFPGPERPVPWCLFRLAPEGCG